MRRRRGRLPMATRRIQPPRMRWRIPRKRTVVTKVDNNTVDSTAALPMPGPLPIPLRAVPHRVAAVVVAEVPVAEWVAAVSGAAAVAWADMVAAWEAFARRAGWVDVTSYS